jgi:hypothetical protein
MLFLANAVLGLTHLHFLYAAPLLTLIDLMILIRASARAAGNGPRTRGARAWTLDFQGPERRRLAALPRWQDYRLQAAVLLALTACVVVAFR